MLRVRALSLRHHHSPVIIAIHSRPCGYRAPAAARALLPRRRASFENAAQPQLCISGVLGFLDAFKLRRSRGLLPGAGFDDRSRYYNNCSNTIELRLDVVEGRNSVANL